MIEAQLKKVEWRNLDLSCQFKLSAPTGHDQAHEESLQLMGSLAPTHPDGPLQLHWTNFEKETYTAQEVRVNSLEEALPLFLSFRRNDGQWKTAVKWTVTETEKDDEPN